MRILKILLLISIVLISCKENNSKNNRNIEPKTDIGFKKETLKKIQKISKKDTIIKEIVIKKKIEKQSVKYHLIIDKDTLIVENFDFTKHQEFSVKCKGKLSNTEVFYIRKFKENSSYLYCLGNNPDLTIKKDNYTIKYLTIFLIKSNIVIDKINIKNRANSHYVIGLRKDRKFSIEGFDEIINLGYGQGFCGGDYGEYLFFRKKDKLIKGLSLGGYGEPGTDFYSQDFVLPKNNEKNQIWIENKYGDSKYNEYKNTGTLYIRHFEKYEMKNDSLVLLNPKKDEFYYVTAENGLTERSSPNSYSNKLSKIELGKKIKVLNKTLIEHSVMDNGKLIKGNWMQIESPNNKYFEPTYVFGGYLSKISFEK